MSDPDEARWQKLREELSAPDPRLPYEPDAPIPAPEPKADLFGAYANEHLFSFDYPNLNEVDEDAQFEPYTAEDGTRGYLVTRRAE